MSNKFEDKDFSEEGLNYKLWKRIYELMSPLKKPLLLMFFLNTITALLDVLFPYMNRIVMDYFVPNIGNDVELIFFGLVYVSAIVMQTITIYLYFYKAGQIEMELAYDIRNKAFKKLQSLSFSYFDTTPIGWLMARMTSDISRLADIVSWSLMDIVWGLGVMLFSTIIMLITNIPLTILVLIVVPLLAYISIWFQINILKNYRGVRKINSKITSAFNEGITGAKTTKTLSIEKSNFNEFDYETSLMKDTSIKAATLSSLFRPIVMSISSFSLAFVLWYGGNKVLVGTIGFGTLMMFTQYALQFFEPLRQIAALIGELQMAQASGERIISLLDSEPKIVDRDDVIEKYGTEINPKINNYEPMYGDVEFKNVNFSYIEDEIILNNFNLKVKKGETIALVGETGSGKSTIVNLLCRFYEPTSGQILIDGKDYRERSIGWLHYNLGYVLQSPHLFSGTIMENVRYGKLNATDDEVYAACKLVNADEFINKLENGYNTDVGEGGSRLSTGQKQLISFARALISNPCIFVLDEATSSIDTETEQVIQYAIDNLMKNKTAFIIAHRLSTIVKADKILVIKSGKIKEIGTHEQLMSQKGYYYRLYTNQFNESLEKELMNKKGEPHAIFS